VERPASGGDVGEKVSGLVAKVPGVGRKVRNADGKVRNGGGKVRHEPQKTLAHIGLPFHDPLKLENVGAKVGIGAGEIGGLARKAGRFGRG
jgi:hypothetical protein